MRSHKTLIVVALVLASAPSRAQEAADEQSLYNQLRRLNGEAALKRAMLELNELDEKIANSKAAQRRSSQQFNGNAVPAPTAVMSLPPPVAAAPVVTSAPTTPSSKQAMPASSPVLPRILNIGGTNGVLQATLLLPDGRRQQDVGVGTVLDGGYRVAAMTATSVHVTHGRNTIPLTFAKPAAAAAPGRPAVSIFDLPPPQAR